MASYSGLYVDEYQDCTKGQHKLIVKLGELLPCRVVGDPLQSIFGFGHNVPVDWETDVRANFDQIGNVTTPWRWKGKNEALGEWLREARVALEKGEKIDLRNDVVTWISTRSGNERALAIRACHDAASKPGSVVVVRKWRNQCNDLARYLRGRFAAVEPVECPELSDWVECIEQSSGVELVDVVVEFSSLCLTVVKGALTGPAKLAKTGRLSKTAKYERQARALVELARDQSTEVFASALKAIRRTEGAKLFRPELFSEMVSVLKEHALQTGKTLVEVAGKRRNRVRRMGRVSNRCVIGTTLLVKGLEFDHAVVLDVEKMDAPNLYVALTRASQSLTVLSRDPVITRPASS